MPQRIQRSRKKGWKMPAGAVYVGRPTKWGNPYQDVTRLSGKMRVAFRLAVGAFAVYGRDAAVEQYRAWLHETAQTQLREDARRELAGRDLACWCAAGPCHADVLLELANSEP